MTRPSPSTADTAAPELSRRVRPRQQRSREMVEKILDTTTRLIESGGWDAVTTNRIAEEASIPVSSIYRYFPNKFSILAEICDRQLETQLELLDQYAETAVSATEMPEVIGRLVDAMVAIEKAHPAMAAVHRALSSTPELRDLDERTNATVAAAVTRGLANQGATIPEEALLVVGKVLTRIWIALLDLSNDLGEGQEQRAIGELKLVLQSYLANYLPMKAPESTS